MKTAAVAAATATLAGSASAFVAPALPVSAVRAAQRTSSRAVTKMEFAGGLIGADGPEPTSKNFDPLKLAENNPDKVLFFREAEIKHCRLAMLAIVGLIVPEFVRLPGEIYQGVSVVEAHNAMVEKGPMVQLLFWISLFEIITIPTVWNMDKSDREPGDFSLDLLGFCKDADKKKKYQLSELKNGRLAMMAFSGAITQAVLTGHGVPFLY